MSYYEITIIDENEYYGNLDLTNPCYVEASSEDKALEALYNFAKEYERKHFAAVETKNVSPDMITVTKKDHFKITDKTNDKNSFENTHRQISDNVWTKK